MDVSGVVSRSFDEGRLTTATVASAGAVAGEGAALDDGTDAGGTAGVDSDETVAGASTGAGLDTSATAAVGVARLGVVGAGEGELDARLTTSPTTTTATAAPSASHNGRRLA